MPSAPTPQVATIATSGTPIIYIPDCIYFLFIFYSLIMKRLANHSLIAQSPAALPLWYWPTIPPGRNTRPLLGSGRGPPTCPT